MPQSLVLWHAQNVPLSVRHVFSDQTTTVLHETPIISCRPLLPRHRPAEVAVVMMSSKIQVIDSVLAAFRNVLHAQAQTPTNE